MSNFSPLMQAKPPQSFPSAGSSTHHIRCYLAADVLHVPQAISFSPLGFHLSTPADSPPRPHLGDRTGRAPHSTSTQQSRSVHSRNNGFRDYIHSRGSIHQNPAMVGKWAKRAAHARGATPSHGLVILASMVEHISHLSLRSGLGLLEDVHS
jgi:hypothetical protein